MMSFVYFVVGLVLFGVCQAFVAFCDSLSKTGPETGSQIRPQIGPKIGAKIGHRSEPDPHMAGLQ